MGNKKVGGSVGRQESGVMHRIFLFKDVSSKCIYNYFYLK